MNKKMNLHNIRENIHDVERFANKHVIECMTVAAILIGAFSSWAQLFFGTLIWSMMFMVVGVILGIFFPFKMDMVIKKIYSYSRGKQMTTIIAEGVKILVALFLPVLYFAFLGALTGTAYQYYFHYAHTGHKGNKAA